MSNKKTYNNNCFSPNWIEVNLTEAEARAPSPDVRADVVHTVSESKEERLESRRRKDLNTLLKELDEIKLNIEKVAEKQQRLANLMSFYTEEFAQ